MEPAANGLVGHVSEVLKDNDVRLVTYVPDNVLTPLLNGVTSDNYFRSVCTTREDEAIGVVAGAWMGGMKSVVMMQTSGFALIANALASLTVPFADPVRHGDLRARHAWASSTSASISSRAPCGRCWIRSASPITR